MESSQRKQFNEIPISTPFVSCATIEPGYCLNLIEPESLSILKRAYSGLVGMCDEAGINLPVNNKDNRKLDCAVINYVHLLIMEEGKPSYDTVCCAFPKGGVIYPGTTLSSSDHIQVCVLNKDKINVCFLTRPLADFNPYLKKSALILSPENV